MDFTKITHKDTRSTLQESLVLRGLEHELVCDIEKTRLQSGMLEVLRGEQKQLLSQTRKDFDTLKSRMMPWSKKSEIADMKKNLPGFAEYLSKFENLEKK